MKAQEEKRNKGTIAPSDPWNPLKKYTRARIALGRAGAGVPTKEILSFSLAHAKAKDAVFTKLEIDKLQRELRRNKFTSINLHSMAKDRFEYLKRPDLGRKLDSKSAAILKKHKKKFDVCIIAADGLSASAVNKNFIPLLRRLRQNLSKKKYSTSPVIILEEGRVACGDQIGEILNAKIVVICIGERPGLSSPESLGIYLTYSPRRGTTDEKRNCISNVHTTGLLPIMAADKLSYLIDESILKKLSGVELKDESVLIHKKKISV